MPVRQHLLTATAVLLLFSTLAKADILLLDLNLNDKEIISAQKVADRHGEKLVVFPVVQSEIRKAFHKLEATKASIIEKIKACKIDELCVKQNLDLFAEASKNQEDLLANVPFSANELSRFLYQMDREGRSFSTFIESGHAGEERFAGVFVNALTHADLTRVVQDKSSLKSVKYVLYWGCYTMTLGAVKNRWPKVFPHAQLIAGFDDMGPLGFRPESGGLLEQLLFRSSEAIDAGASLSRLKSFFKTIHYSHTTNLAISIEYNTYVSNRYNLLIPELSKMCSAEQYSHFADIVKCYGDAKTNDCANPPENVLGGILNEGYNKLRTMDHCFDHTNGLLDSNLKVEFEYALRLMYFKNVKSNYARFHAKDLAHFNEAISHYPIPSQLALTDLENMTRQELVKRIKGLMMYSPLMSSKIQANIKSIHYSLVVLNVKSIPPAWIKPFARDGIPTGYDEFKM